MKDCLVWFKKTSFEQLIKEGESKYPLETGGLFVGYQLSNDEVVVTRVIGPGPLASHKSDRFIPDQKYHEAELLKHFYKSDHLEVYLGDWHTHPNLKAYLSNLDLKTLKRIARFKNSQLDYPLMGILGGEPYEFKIWQYISPKFPFFNFKVLVRECLVKFY